MKKGVIFLNFSAGNPSVILCNSESVLPSNNSELGHDMKRNKRKRTIFTAEQLDRLEHEFQHQQYVVGQERKYLAIELGLNEIQVKVCTNVSHLSQCFYFLCVPNLQWFYTLNYQIYLFLTLFWILFCNWRFYKRWQTFLQCMIGICLLATFSYQWCNQNRDSHPWEHLCSFV